MSHLEKKKEKNNQKYSETANWGHTEEFFGFERDFRNSLKEIRNISEYLSFNSTSYYISIYTLIFLEEAVSRRNTSVGETITEPEKLSVCLFCVL